MHGATHTFFPAPALRHGEHLNDVARRDQEGGKSGSAAARELALGETWPACGGLHLDIAKYRFERARVRVPHMEQRSERGTCTDGLSRVSTMHSSKTVADKVLLDAHLLPVERRLPTGIRESPTWARRMQMSTRDLRRAVDRLHATDLAIWRRK